MKSNSVNTFHYLAKVEFNSTMDWTSRSFYIRTLSFFHSGIWGKRCHCTFSSQKWKKGQLQQSSNCINPIHWQAYHQHCLPHKQNWSGQWSTQWLAGVNKITIAVEWKNMSNLINKIHLTIYQTVKADKTTDWNYCEVSIIATLALAQISAAPCWIKQIFPVKFHQFSDNSHQRNNKKIEHWIQHVWIWIRHNCKT